MMHRLLLHELATARVSLLAAYGSDGGPIRRRQRRSMTERRTGLAGLVTGQLELSDDGKAMKYFELVPCEVRVTAETVLSALAEGEGNGAQALDTEESDQ
jgi:hypothetical protein